jgi:protein gp37
MSDLFQDGVSTEYIVRVATVMHWANWHTYQILTKRAERMARLLGGELSFAAKLPHIWWGVSVEDRKHGLARIDELRSAPGRVRFLSVEPLIEDLGVIDLAGIQWVIVGGESGPRARPMQAEWVDSIYRQCRSARVPFFFKQWGGTRKSESGRVLHGRTYDDFPRLVTRSEPRAQERLALETRFRQADQRGRDPFSPLLVQLTA